MADVLLTTAEVAALRLTTGGCCCVEHPHRWYERTDETTRLPWIECYHCAEPHGLPSPDWRTLLG